MKRGRWVFAQRSDYLLRGSPMNCEIRSTVFCWLAERQQGVMLRKRRVTNPQSTDDSSWRGTRQGTIRLYWQGSWLTVNNYNEWYVGIFQIIEKWLIRNCYKGTKHTLDSSKDNNKGLALRPLELSDILRPFTRQDLNDSPSSRRLRRGAHLYQLLQEESSQFSLLQLF